MSLATLPPLAETASAPPLLPSVLVRPAAYLWLWALPIAVLLALNVQGYWIISGNMDSAQTKMAWILGLCGVANFVAGIVQYVVTKWFARNRTTTWWWGLPAILIQTAYLWLAVSKTDALLPNSVEVWIYPSQRFLFNQFAFAMPPLFFGILQVACATPAHGTVKPILLSGGMAVGAPVMLYLVALTVRYFPNPGGLAIVVFATLIIALGVIMFVGVVRVLMIGLRFIQRWQMIAERIAVIVIALLLPLGGLWLNHSLPFPVDFQAWEVYALTLVNAVILVTASWIHASRPRLSFNLLCFSLPFSLYFFIVFLPYTPLSILAVIVMGAGVLVLTPTFLFILHIHLLNRARVAIAQIAGGATLPLIPGLVCFLALPAFFTLRAVADKAALTSALDYVLAPSVQAGGSRYPGNRANLRRALASHRAYKAGIYYPLLSDFYSWLVFDNLVLPDPTLAQVEQTFFGTTGSTQSSDPLRHKTGSLFGGASVRDRARVPRAAPLPQTAHVSDLQLRASPIEPNFIQTLSMTLQNSGPLPAEFRTAIPLPAGVFVRGFRLDVNGTLVPGRLFEKKTARWVYEMIRDSERRDPGLLYYSKPDELELRVFPIDPTKPTHLEIDFCVAQNVDTSGAPVATNDPSVVLNWLRDVLQPRLVASPDGVFFAAATPLAASLPVVEREPYLHVIVDRSEKTGFNGDLRETLALLRTKFPQAREARVTLAHYDVVDLVSSLTPLPELVRRPPTDLEQILPQSGGLDLDRVVAHALRQHRDSELDGPRTNDIPPRPIMVLLTHSAAPRKLALPLTEAWADLCPDLEIAEIGEDGTQNTHHVAGSTSKPLLRCGVSMRPLTANVATCFKAGDSVDQVQYWSPAEGRWKEFPEATRREVGADWSEAASLTLRQKEYGRDPGTARIGLAALVKASRESGILIPATSYIVVENMAQWRMLELSEKQKLGQNAALEFRESPSPSAFAVAGLFGAYVWLRWRRQKRRSPLREQREDRPPIWSAAA